MPNHQPLSAPEHKDTFTQGSQQDLTKWIQRFANLWYVFIAGLLIALSIAFLINKFTHPVYKGRTTILVSSEKNNPVGAEALIRDLSFDNQTNIRNEIGILKSYSLAKRTLKHLDLATGYFKIPRVTKNWRIQSLQREQYLNSPIKVTSGENEKKLYNTPFFIRILSPGSYLLEFEATINEKQVAQTDTFRFGQPIRSPYFSFTVNLRDKYASGLFDKNSDHYTFDYSVVFYDSDQLASQFSNNLQVNFYFDDASILELSLQGKHPEKITDYLNHHARAFIENGLEEKNQIASATIRFIDEQISGISDSLQEAESDFQKFRSRNKVINISTEGNYAMEKLENLVSQKSDLQRRSKYYDYLYDYIMNSTDFDDVIVPNTMGIADPSLNNLVSRLAESYATRNRLLMTARENSPQVKQATGEIENIKDALTENIRNIINTSAIEMEVIENQIAEVNRQIQKLPGTEREYINIQRDFTLNDNIYTFLLQKRAEAGIALASNVSDHKIVDPALRNTTFQTTPKPLANMIIAGLLGLLLPAIGIILKDSLNNRINARFMVEDHTTIPVLAHIEHYRSGKKLPVLEFPRSPLTESFRALRTNIDFMLGKNAQNPVLALTSSISGEGKSFCSANLGAIFALTGKKVLVVGMDLRKPQTHTEFSIDNSKGLSNVLIGTETADNVLVESRLPGLFVVPSGPIPPNPAELLQSEEMGRFLNEMRNKFDMVILDTPPLALVADTLLVTEETDLNLFILRQGISKKQALTFINHMVESGRIRKTGLLINDVKILNSYSPANRYGYGYGYGRFKNSGYYDSQ
jgi:capsular exopolysaccharide synthesis family protein